MRRFVTPKTNWALFRLIALDPRPQYEIAQAIGRSDAWLSRVIHGRAIACKEDQERIAEVLGASINDLFQEPSAVIA